MCYSEPPIYRKGLIDNIRSKFAKKESIIECINDIHENKTITYVNIIDSENIKVIAEDGLGIRSIQEFLGKTIQYKSNSIGISKRGIGSKTFHMTMDGQGIWVFSNGGEMFGYKFLVKNGKDIYKIFLSGCEKERKLNWLDTKITIYPMDNDDCDMYKRIIKNLLPENFNEKHWSLHIISKDDKYKNILLDKDYDKILNKKPEFEDEDDEKEWVKFKENEKNEFINDLSQHYMLTNKFICLNGVTIKNNKLNDEVQKILKSESPIDVKQKMCFLNPKYKKTDMDIKKLLGHYESYDCVFTFDEKNDRTRNTCYVKENNKKRMKYVKIKQNCKTNETPFTNIKRSKTGIEGNHDQIVDFKTIVFQTWENNGRALFFIDKSLVFSSPINKSIFKTLPKKFNSYTHLGVAIIFNKENENLEKCIDFNEVKSKSNMKSKFEKFISNIIKYSCNNLDDYFQDVKEDMEDMEDMEEAQNKHKLKNMAKKNFDSDSYEICCGNSRSINPTLKKNIWMNMNGNKFEAECPLCEKLFDPFTCEMGHIKSHKDGGIISKKNIIPICQTCNRSMNSMNMLKYQRKCWPKKKNIFLENLRNCGLMFNSW